MKQGLAALAEESGPLLNGYCMLPSAAAVEFYARQGFDLVTVDMQHGLHDYSTTVAALQGLTAIDVVPMVRVPWLEPSVIMKVLDAGAMGVTCPMINSADDAHRLVSYAHYPPLGERSLGPIRAAAIHGADYVRATAGRVATLAMIETAQGLAEVDAIAAVPGLTGLYIGPGDLALALGRPSHLDRFDDVVGAAIDTIKRACRREGKLVGTFAPTPERAHALAQDGFDIVTLNTDVAALQTQAAAWVSKYRTLSRT